ncbi:MAG TPA: RluA family pseudouridine synthase [Polyangiaceae bacterium]|nr:RluA family pseudouridine synthase [Polyangiaceae bacterium]
MRQRIVLGSEQSGERVDKVLSLLTPEVSRATAQRWIKEGRVLLNGHACTASDRVAAGSVVEWTAGPAPISNAEPDASVPFEVVYDDEHLLVVNKPAGVVVHPARGHIKGTLVSGLLARGGFEQLSADPRDAHGSLRPGIVHRLDKGTSGLLVVARSDAAREGLKTQLQARTVRREYLAITVGVPGLSHIETQYGRHPKSRLRFTSLIRTGKPAITNVQLIERLAGGRAALVQCRLQTGRTHQIRVHLAEQAKSPVFADALYGGVPKDAALRPVADQLGRQALHAHTLGFVHPITGQRLDFSAALPADMDAALAALRRL